MLQLSTSLYVGICCGFYFMGFAEIAISVAISCCIAWHAVAIFHGLATSWHITGTTPFRVNFIMNRVTYCHEPLIRLSCSYLVGC